MKRKVKILLTVAGLLFFTAGVLSVGMFIGKPTNVRQRAAASTNLSVAPSSQTTIRGQDITFSVLMDTGTNRVTGLDIELNFDPNTFQIGSLKKGAGAANLNNTISSNFDNSNGKIFYALFTLDKTQAVQGTGVEVLQVKGKVTNSASAGSYVVTFDPSTAVSATSESTNALLGTVPGTLIVNLSATPTASPTPRTPTPTATATASGSPNSCGGTCGSNLNCEANLFCYQGYCRNPSCSWSNDCSCSSTPSPTKAPTNPPAISYNTTPRPNKTSTPIAVKLTPEPVAEATPGNFWENVFNSGENVENGPTPTLAPVDLPESKAGNFLPWIIGSLIVAGVTLIFIVMGILKEAGRKKAKPPLIKV